MQFPEGGDQTSRLSVLVVGVGPGGLLTALECCRRSFKVQILEKSPSFSMQGDGFSIGPTALTTLHHYEEMLKGFHDISYDALFTLRKHSGDIIFGPLEAEWNRPSAAHPAKGVHVPWINSRPRFGKMLLDEVQRRGIPLEWGQQVVNYSENESYGIAITQDGRKYEADIVVAADGVGTRSHLAVLGKEVKAVSSGYALFRAAFPIDAILQSEKIRHSIGWQPGQRPEFRIYIAPDMHMNLILTDDVVFYILTHADHGSADESWTNKVSPQQAIKVAQEISGWDPAVLEVIKQTPSESLVDWRLMWRDPQPQWASPGGRIVQVGDSAHSFVPTSGNGATQALEDAISLATCLQIAGKENAHLATRVHATLRFERVSTIQKMGFVTRQGFHFFDADEKPKEEQTKKITMGKWIWTHDAGKYAEDNYDQALSHLLEGTPFENTNLPPGYRYEPWTVEQEMEKEKQGIMSDLRENGDWSA